MSVFPLSLKHAANNLHLNHQPRTLCGGCPKAVKELPQSHSTAMPPFIPCKAQSQQRKGSWEQRRKEAKNGDSVVLVTYMSSMGQDQPLHIGCRRLPHSAHRWQKMKLCVAQMFFLLSLLHYCSGKTRYEGIFFNCLF